jgi:hypothetical protein
MADPKVELEEVIAQLDSPDDLERALSSALQ